MHPHHLLSEMVDDHRRQLIGEADAFRRMRPNPIDQVRMIQFVRHALGSRLVRFGETLGGTPVPASGPQS